MWLPFSKKKESVVPEEVGFIRQLNRDLTIRNSFRSMFRNATNGAVVVQSTASSIVDGFHKSMESSRNETFEAACDRFGILPHDLPLIHNQLLLQIYLSFYMSIAAFAFWGNFMISGTGIMIKLASFSIGMACLSNAFQSSLQAFRVRNLSLGGTSTWLNSPGEWFPSRILNTLEIAVDDSRLDIQTASLSATRSRRYFLFSAIISAATLPLYLTSDKSTIPGLSLLAIFFSFLFLIFAIKNSFFVMQFHSRTVCDLLAWFLTPKAWIPNRIEIKRMASANSLKKTVDTSDSGEIKQ
jgi:hypothetical protein